MDVQSIVSQMTLEEKAGLCSGQDFWHTKAVERLGVPAVMVSDGPQGLRKQDEGGDHLGMNDSIQAVAFPAGCGVAASFDRELIGQMGDILGTECQAENVSVLLGPAVNIKRSPLCGRNFEYLSEDPYLAGEMAASYIQGVQSHHVGTSIKHFALNNQEHERMSGSSEVDERTMREIYLPAFETAVKKSQPKTIMNSYNRINGVFAAENPWLLTEVLRDEWGFEGYVVSDWGANNDRVEGLKAGEDLEMPGGSLDNDHLIVEAVRSGQLDEAVLDRACERILRVAADYLENREEAVFDRAADHEKAAAVAEQCMVLLKNERAELPLDAKEQNILFVGGFAKTPRFQGGGSSHINSYRIESALDAAAAMNLTQISYAEGFSAKEDVIDDQLQAEALEAAKKASRVVIFAGLPDVFESEGYDRTHMRLPECQNLLIEKIAAVNSHVTIVLHNGSPVEMPWIDKVQAVLEAYLGGEASGRAAVRILFGEANPSGKLAETFPLRLEDNPSYLNFPGKGGKVHYAEGIFVGYRYYDTKNMQVLFPFGYGLSYTTFAVDNMKISLPETGLANGRDLKLSVTVDVQNTGTREGSEVVQLYVADRTDTALRPAKELKGFAKVSLQPGEKKTVTMELDHRSFAFFDEDLHDWYAPAGQYGILVGTSSRDIAAEAEVTLQESVKKTMTVHRNTTFGELLSNPVTAAAVKDIAAPFLEVMGVGGAEDNVTDASKEAISDEMTMAMMKYMPLRAMRSFSSLTNQNVDEIVEKLNAVLQQQ